MPAGGLMHEDVLVVSEGFDALTRPLVGIRKYEQKFEVWDGAGQMLGHVEPAFRDSGLSKLFRFLFALVFSGSTSRDVLDYRVVDKLANTLLLLEIRGEILYVKDPTGELVGSVMNTSKPRELEATFYAGEPRTGLFGRRPPPIASMLDRVDEPPYEYELKSSAGLVFARVSNPGGRRHTLEILDRSDTRLHALAVGFACGMVDRVWLKVRPVPNINP